MTLARWPNEGFVKIVDVVWGRRPWTSAAPRADRTASSSTRATGRKRWVGEKDVWLHGYWFWDWADQRQQGRVDRHREARRSRWRRRTTATATARGSGSTPSTSWRNSTQPGEWYLDRETGILYFWPPAPDRAGPGRRLGRADAGAALQDASHVTLRGLMLEAARGTAVADQRRRRTTGSPAARSATCGGDAVTVAGGTDNGVVGCDIYEIGDGGHLAHAAATARRSRPPALRREQPHPPLQPLEPDVQRRQSRSTASATARRTT